MRTSSSSGGEYKILVKYTLSVETRIQIHSGQERDQQLRDMVSTLDPAIVSPQMQQEWRNNPDHYMYDIVRSHQLAYIRNTLTPVLQNQWIGGQGRPPKEGGLRTAKIEVPLTPEEKDWIMDQGGSKWIRKLSKLIDAARDQAHRA